MLRYALLMLCVCGAALAQDRGGGFTVSPVRLEMAAGARAISLTLASGVTQTRSFQVEAMRWTQVEGQDVYEPAPELIVNPPVFRIAPGGKQVVRAGFRVGAPSASVESAYRLYLQEVPDGDEPPPNQLRMVLRIGVPLFVAPVGTAREAPQWSVQRDPDGSSSLQLSNTGNRRLRLDTISVSDGQGHGLDLRHMTYVLPGQTRRWNLPPGLHAPLRVAASSDVGPFDVTLQPP